MPQIPTRHDLGRISVNGRATPASINPNVAYDIGRAGAAWKAAFDEIGRAFGSLGAKAQAVQDRTWLAENKLALLQADDEIRRDTELNAESDGTGFEAAPLKLKSTVEELEQRPGGSQEARTEFKLWSAEKSFETGRWAADSAQKRLRDTTVTRLDSSLDTLTNLTSARPENALEYFQTYEQEVRSLQGTAITVAEADERISQARQNILKTATISKAVKDPAAFARAVGALEGAGVETDPDVNTELRSLPQDRPSQKDQSRLLISEGQQKALTKVDRGVVERFGQLQGALGREFKINSGYRSPEHNRKVGGASKSRHLHGEAIDIDVSDLSEEERIEVINEASRLGFTGIGVYENSIHLDIGKRRAWGPSYGRESVPSWARGAIAAHEKGAVRSSGSVHMASISGRLETGTFNPLRGVRQVARDAGGTKSYGNFGLNSGGSAQQFQREYGERFGLTARPGTAAFDKQWRNAAARAPGELHAAEMQWYEDNIGSKVQSGLVKAGVAPGMAADPRVQAYFADRMIQYGPASTSKHRDRVRDAFAASGGDVEAFLGEMSKRDLANLQNDFPTALRTGRYSARGHNTRVTGRERLALGVDGTDAPHKSRAKSEAERLGVDLSTLPKIDGPIQPHELLSLSPEDYGRVVTELRPHLEVDLENKMQDALASVAAKGSQNVITPEEIDDYGVIIGPKRAEKWKVALVEAEELYDVTQEIIQMTPEQRSARLSSLVPTGRVEDLAADERRRFEITAQAIKNVNTQLEKDALGFLTLHNESGRQAMKMIADAPMNESGTAIRERGFDTLIALQRQQGIPPSEIAIVGANGAQKIANEMNELRSGPAAKALVDRLTMIYGRHTPQMWAEIARHGGPSEYKALTTATRRGQDALVESFVMERASAEGAGKDAAKKNFLRERTGETQKDIDRAVSDEIIEFTSTIQGGVYAASAREVYHRAVSRAAMVYMIRDGKGLQDAVRTAADDLFRTNVAVRNGVAIPRKEVDQRSSNFISGINNGLPALIDKVSPNISRVIPDRPSTSQGFEHRQYIQSIKNNGKMITNSEGTGVFVIGEAGEFVMVGTPNGNQRLFFTWDEIEAIGKVKPKDPILYDAQGIPRSQY